LVMSGLEQVFVYGTLRPPRSGTPADDSRFYPQVASLVQGVVPARLAEAVLYDLGSYPAARPGQGVIYGDLLAVASEAVLIMDQIEGHPTFYRRERVRVQTDDGPELAWIYWAPEGITAGRRSIPAGDWFRRGDGALETGDPVGPTAGDRPGLPEVDSVLKELVKRFAEAECSWLSSVRPGGRAHSAPVWHVWFQGRVYVITTTAAVKTANIAQRPGVVITHPDPLNPVIVEGWATFAPAMWAELQPHFKAKYDWDFSQDDDYDTIIEVTPTKLMAWGKYGEGRWGADEVARVLSF
jgi:gamma-glutamylcyclotransferase (GGCT)/AIG2-like uncharacterized protein YtfP